VPEPGAGRELPGWPPLPGSSVPALDQLAEEVRQQLGARSTLVSVVSSAGHAIPGAAGDWPRERWLALGGSPCHHVAATGVAVLVDDLRQEGHPLARSSGGPVPWLVAYAGVPLTDASGRTVGALCGLEDRPRRWGLDDLGVLEQAAQRCARLVRAHAIAVAREENRNQTIRTRRWDRGALAHAAAELDRLAAVHRGHQLAVSVGDALAATVTRALADPAAELPDVATLGDVVEPVLVDQLGVREARLAVAAAGHVWLASHRPGAPAGSVHWSPVDDGHPAALGVRDGRLTLGSLPDAGAEDVGAEDVGAEDVGVWACVPVVPAVADRSALFVRWPVGTDLPPGVGEPLSRVADLIAAALDEVRLAELGAREAQQLSALRQAELSSGGRPPGAPC
jgi:hypothetical protein